MSLYLIFFTAAAIAFAAASPELELVKQDPQPVISIRHAGAAGNRFGFEGGRAVKVGSTYHLFTSEMFAAPIWGKMRLAHWRGPNGTDWTRVGTLYESSGKCTGTDARDALWSPLMVFDEQARRWNLFYVGYRCKPNTAQQFLVNHKGEIWRAISQSPGEQGIGGPYKDAGVVMRPGPDSLPWEGLQGTDSFFPYRAGGRWYALYGSARTEQLPIRHWLVGLASAATLAGPWKRIPEHSPAPLEKRFIENPIVTPLPGGGFLAVYDNEGRDTIGYSFSADGISWQPGRSLRIQTKPGVWSKDVRTPLGLIPEGGNEYTIFYTGFEDDPNWDAFMKDQPGNAKCSVGKARVRLRLP